MVFHDVPKLFCPIHPELLFYEKWLSSFIMTSVAILAQGLGSSALAHRFFVSLSWKPWILALRSRPEMARSLPTRGEAASRQKAVAQSAASRARIL